MNLEGQLVFVYLDQIVANGELRFDVARAMLGLPLGVGEPDLLTKSQTRKFYEVAQDPERMNLDSVATDAVEGLVFLREAGAKVIMLSNRLVDDCWDVTVKWLQDHHLAQYIDDLILKPNSQKYTPDARWLLDIVETVFTLNDGVYKIGVVAPGRKLQGFDQLKFVGIKSLDINLYPSMRAMIQHVSYTEPVIVIDRPVIEGIMQTNGQLNFFYESWGATPVQWFYCRAGYKPYSIPVLTNISNAFDIINQITPYLERYPGWDISKVDYTSNLALDPHLYLISQSTTGFGLDINRRYIGGGGAVKNDDNVDPTIDFIGEEHLRVGRGRERLIRVPTSDEDIPF